MQKIHGIPHNQPILQIMIILNLTKGVHICHVLLNLLVAIKFVDLLLIQEKMILKIFIIRLLILLVTLGLWTIGSSEILVFEKEE